MLPQITGLGPTYQKSADPHLGVCVLGVGPGDPSLPLQRMLSKQEEVNDS